jgi:hypothetical protein
VASHRHHWFGSNVGFFPQSRAKTAAQNEDRDFGGIHRGDLIELPIPAWLIADSRVTADISQ